MKLSTFMMWLELAIRRVFTTIIDEDSNLKDSVEETLNSVWNKENEGENPSTVTNISVNYSDVHKVEREFTKAIMAYNRTNRKIKKAKAELAKERTRTEQETKALEKKASADNIISYRNDVISSAKAFISMIRMYCLKVAEIGSDTYNSTKNLCKFAANGLELSLNDISYSFEVEETRTVVMVSEGCVPIRTQMPINSITEVIGDDAVYMVSATALGFRRCPPMMMLTIKNGKLTADEDEYASAKEKDRIDLVLVTFSAKGLKDLDDKHGIYILKTAFDSHKALFIRKRVLKNVDYDKWDELITKRDYAQRSRDIAEKKFEAIDGAEQRAEKRAMNESLRKKNDSLNAAEEALRRFEEVLPKKARVNRKWTTQKYLQSIQLAFTPSVATGIELTEENTKFIEFGAPKDYDTPEELKKLVALVSGATGEISIKDAKKISQLGHDGDIILSRQQIIKDLKAGKIKNIKAVKTLLKYGTGQGRGDKGDDGYFAFKGCYEVMDIPYHIVSQNTVKDSFLYEDVAVDCFKPTANGNFCELRMLSSEQKVGKLQLGRQVTQGLSEITDEEIAALVGFGKPNANGKLNTIGSNMSKYSCNVPTYAWAMSRKIKTMIDLPDNEYRWIRSIWAHPGFQMSTFKEEFGRYHKAMSGNVSAYGILSFVTGDTEHARKEICEKLGIDIVIDEDRILKSNQIRVPKGTGLRPFAVGSTWKYDKPVKALVLRYPYTSPIYVIVEVIGESNGAYVEVSMDNSDITALALAADFDGDHVYVIFEESLINAAERSNEVRKALGMRYTVYDDNHPAEGDTIDFCSLAEYGYRAPSLGNAGTATSPIFLLNSLIPNSAIYEKASKGKKLTPETAVKLPHQDKVADSSGYVCVVEENIEKVDANGNKYTVPVLKRHTYEHVVSKYGSDKAKETVVRIKDIVRWIMMVCADITWQVDAVKRAAKSPVSDSYEGKRLAAFISGLMVASEPHDHPFDEDKIGLLGDMSEFCETKKTLIYRSIYCASDRFATFVESHYNCTGKSMTEYTDFSRSNDGFVIDVNATDFAWHNGWIMGSSIKHGIETGSLPEATVNKLLGVNRISFNPAEVDNLEDYSCGCGIRWSAKDIEDGVDPDYTKVNASAWKGSTRSDLVAGAWTMRCLRALTKREYAINAADPRSKFKLAHKAFAAGRMVVKKWAIDNKYGEINDEVADILLYNSIITFVLGSSVSDVTGEELMFVLGWYTKEKINGETNTHRYLHESLAAYDKVHSYEDFKVKAETKYKHSILGKIDDENGGDESNSKTE